MSEVRPEVVREILRRNPLALDAATDAEGEEAARIEALRGIVDRLQVLDHLGFPVSQHLPLELSARFIRPTNVANATFIEAVSMWRQSTAYDAAMRLLVAWWPHQAEDKCLGELLQAIPSDVAAEVVEHLRRAGSPDLPDLGGD